MTKFERDGDSYMLRTDATFILWFEQCGYNGTHPVFLNTFSKSLVVIIPNRLRKGFRSLVMANINGDHYSFGSTQKMKHLVARFNSQIRKQTMLKYGLDGDESFLWDPLAQRWIPPDRRRRSQYQEAIKEILEPDVVRDANGTVC